MLTPLYPISTEPATITVVAPGALAGATSVPVAPLPVALPAGYILDFGSSKFAKLSGARGVGALSLGVEALPTALDAGDEVDVLGSAAALLIGDKWAKLGGLNTTADERSALQLAYQIGAELALELQEPAYTGKAADKLAYAVAYQILFMLEQGITPSAVKSVAQGNPGATKVFRDRWIDPTAARIVARVTGRRAVRFEPFMAGV